MNAAALCDRTRFYDKKKPKKFWRSLTNYSLGLCAAATASVSDWNGVFFNAAEKEQRILGSQQEMAAD